jgi:hopanoid C-2 methylase
MRRGGGTIPAADLSSGAYGAISPCRRASLYGRQPRIKTPAQLLAELDLFISQPNHPPMIYFVDDNFIGNRKATRNMLPHLIDWQKRHGYPLQFACEATLNLANQTDILEMMREAAFHTLFVGIETPELEALKSMDKGHNAKVPMLEAIETLNRYGLEVTSGIIIGLDTDTSESPGRLLDFIRQSQVPVLTINLLQALPKTPLWDRLARADRLAGDPSLESNVKFLRPYDEVVARWRQAIAYAYSPGNLFSRFTHQVRSTYVNRLRTPARTKLTLANLRRAMVLAANIVWRIGVLAGYRREFWRAARHAVRHGQLESVFGMGFVAYHLIRFTGEALRGEQNASFYAAKARQRAAPSAKLPPIGTGVSCKP